MSDTENNCPLPESPSYFKASTVRSMRVVIVELKGIFRVGVFDEVKYCSPYINYIKKKKITIFLYSECNMIKFGVHPLRFIFLSTFPL